MFAEDKSTNDNLYNGLYNSKLVGGKWVTTCINNNIGTLVDLKIAENKIAYIVDTDNNLGGEIINGEETVYKYDDKLIYTVTADNLAPTLETDFYGLYNGISVINGELVYSENGYLTKLSDKTKLINTQLPEKYEILTDKNGMADAIIFADSKENASNAFGIFYDKENKLWGNAVKAYKFSKRLPYYRIWCYTSE